jgi:hypothetical protein
MSVNASRHKQKNKTRGKGARPGAGWPLLHVEEAAALRCSTAMHNVLGLGRGAAAQRCAKWRR